MYPYMYFVQTIYTNRLTPLLLRMHNERQVDPYNLSHARDSRVPAPLV